MKGELCIYDKHILCRQSIDCMNCVIYLHYIREENKEK